MFSIIPASQFKTTPWKNGQGVTTELAISEGGSLTDFDWRISMASVCNDGEFSNFTGYQRNLILIKGNGITLTCKNSDKQTFTYKLINLLDIARFDGADSTYGELVDGTIIDFNIMTRQGSVHANVATFVGQQSYTVKPETLTFIYSLTSDIVIDDRVLVPVGDLLHITPENTEVMNLSAMDLIIVELLPF